MSNANALADSPGRPLRSPFQGRRQVQDRHIAMLFIMPTLILLILINVFPLLYSLYLSFTD